MNTILLDSLEDREILRNEQDAKMTDLEDLQSLASVVAKETTVWWENCLKSINSKLLINWSFFIFSGSCLAFIIDFIFKEIELN